MSCLVQTTCYELAVLTDELDIGNSIVFTTEDPDELAYYQLKPCKYNVIYKSKLLHEKKYSVIIGLINGCCTMSKDIHIITNGNVDDEDTRLEGMQNFIEEYYENYMTKNQKNCIYLIVNP